MSDIARLIIERLSESLYATKTVFDGQDIDSEDGFASIGAALRSAGRITGPIRGFEVVYQGLVIGTYSRNQIVAAAEVIAQAAVDTIHALAD